MSLLALLLFLILAVQADWFASGIHNTCSERPWLVSGSNTALPCSPKSCSCSSQSRGDCQSTTCSSTFPSGYVGTIGYSSPDCQSGTETSFQAYLNGVCGTLGSSSTFPSCSGSLVTLRQYSDSPSCSGSFTDIPMPVGCTNTPNAPQASYKVICDGSTPPSSTPPSSPPPTTPPPSLPSDCYNPEGTNCTWYKNCLEKQQPCGSTSSDAYALPYGTKYCELYSQNFGNFSVKGQNWINAVRKCLQVALVPLLDNPPDCPTIKHLAFQSHTPCYTAPAPGISVCFVVNDVLNILTTIRQAFLTDRAATIEQGVDSLLTCIGGVYFNVSKIYIQNTLTDISDSIQGQISNFVNSTKTGIFVWTKEIFGSRKRSTNQTEYYLAIGGTSDLSASDVMASVISGQRNGSIQIIDSIETCGADGCGLASDACFTTTLSLVMVILLVLATMNI